MISFGRDDNNGLMNDHVTSD